MQHDAHRSQGHFVHLRSAAILTLRIFVCTVSQVRVSRLFVRGWLEYQLLPMDPTVAELNEMRSVADICAWVGVKAELQAALFEQIGLNVPRRVRHMVAIKEATWSTSVGRVRIPGETEL